MQQGKSRVLEIEKRNATAYHTTQGNNTWSQRWNRNPGLSTYALSEYAVFRGRYNTCRETELRHLFGLNDRCETRASWGQKGLRTQLSLARHTHRPGKRKRDQVHLCSLPAPITLCSRFTRRADTSKEPWACCVDTHPFPFRDGEL